MNPVAFSIFSIEVRWYGIFISLGMILGLLIASYTSKVRRINYDHIIDTLLVAIPSGIVGARLYYVIFNLPYYLSHPENILKKLPHRPRA